jgi:hypothetical protein
MHVSSRSHCIVIPLCSSSPRARIVFPFALDWLSPPFKLHADGDYVPETEVQERPNNKRQSAPSRKVKEAQEAANAKFRKAAHDRAVREAAAADPVSSTRPYAAPLARKAGGRASKEREETDGEGLERQQEQQQQWQQEHQQLWQQQQEQRQQQQQEQLHALQQEQEQLHALQQEQEQLHHALQQEQHALQQQRQQQHALQQQQQQWQQQPHASWSQRFSYDEGQRESDFLLLREQTAGAGPQAPPGGRMAGAGPMAPPGGWMAGAGPMAPPGGRMAGAGPQAPPGGRMAGAGPMAPPGGWMAGAGPMAPPGGRMAGAGRMAALVGENTPAVHTEGRLTPSTDISGSNSNVSSGRMPPTPIHCPLGGMAGGVGPPYYGLAAFEWNQLEARDKVPLVVAYTNLQVSALLSEPLCELQPHRARAHSHTHTHTHTHTNAPLPHVCRSHP